MIDLHCHILPRIDDGAQTIDDSIKMAQKASADGIRTILCTPHYTYQYQNTRADIQEAVKLLQKEFHQREIPIRLVAGQEIRLTGELLEQMDQELIQFIDHDHRYLLIEFPYNEVPMYALPLLKKVVDRGCQPIIVHPECNEGLIKNPNQLLSFLDIGCLAQMTAPSVVGVYGKTVEKTAHKMLEHQMVQMLASDAHRLEDRNFYLKEAYQWIEERYDHRMVRKFQHTAKKILKGEPIQPKGYQPIQKKKFWIF